MENNISLCVSFSEWKKNFPRMSPADLASWLIGQVSVTCPDYGVSHLRKRVECPRLSQISGLPSRIMTLGSQNTVLPGLHHKSVLPVDQSSLSLSRILWSWFRKTSLILEGQIISHIMNLTLWYPRWHIQSIICSKALHYASTMGKKLLRLLEMGF